MTAVLTQRRILGHAEANLLSRRRGSPASSTLKSDESDAARLRGIETYSTSAFIAKQSEVSARHPPRPVSLDKNRLLYTGISLLAGSVLLFFGGVYLLLFSHDESNPGKAMSQSFLHRDQHYKYLIFLLIPSGLVFVIVNWGGLHYFRHA